jgi:hypothetical protein|nr:MAG TPA: protein of unknown function (DUF4376) [Caudoviricetes sp.]
MINSKWNKTTGSQGMNPWLPDYLADVYYLFFPVDNGETSTSGSNNVEYWYTEYKGKPTLEQVKQDLYELINHETDIRILSSFIYTDPKGVNHSVWLSQENQFNYMAAINATQMFGDAVLPKTFKFGTDENLDLYTFTTKEELGQFFLKTLNHIHSCIEHGLIVKNSIDWNVYGKEAIHE